MTERTGVRDIRGWFLRGGPENDVVLSSRVRLSRNLSDHRFPGTMTAEEDEKVRGKADEAFAALPDGSRYSRISLGSVEKNQRLVLLERNVIPRDFSGEPDKILYLRDDEQVSCVVNEIDHLRISSLSPGLNLRTSYDQVNELESGLEHSLSFAVSLEWGYLSTEITNIGTGLRASVMLHLPALVATSFLDKAVAVVGRLGLSIKGFMGEDDHSLGNMYQISNQVTIGLSEKDILEKLEEVAIQLVNYERKAREEMMRDGSIGVEDGVWRAFGTLTYAKSISSREAIELLSALRMGVALGIVKDVSLEAITSLLFITQKAHIRAFSGMTDEDADIELIDYARAGLIHEFLESNTLRGGTEHV